MKEYWERNGKYIGDVEKSLRTAPERNMMTIENATFASDSTTTLF